MAENVTIARPYAQAILELAREKNAYAGWSDMLGLMAAVAADADMTRLLDDPRLTENRIAGLLVDVCGDRIDDDGRNLIRVLAENRRVGVIAEIFSTYEKLRQEAEGAVEAELISAYPVTDAQREKISAALSRRLDRQVELTCTVDRDLLGGAIIRAGDLVIDGSVQGKLKRLSTELGH